MVWTEVLFALVIAVLFAAILSCVFGWRHPSRSEPGSAVLFLFLLLFFSAWAGGVWLAPVGPALWGVYWMPFLLVGLLFALLILAASAPGRRPRSAKEAVERAEEAEAAGVVFSIFFWALLLSLIAAIVIRYAGATGAIAQSPA
jgi:hypothetical protein